MATDVAADCLGGPGDSCDAVLPHREKGADAASLASAVRECTASALATMAEARDGRKRVGNAAQIGRAPLCAHARARGMAIAPWRMGGRPGEGRRLCPKEPIRLRRRLPPAGRRYRECARRSGRHSRGWRCSMLVGHLRIVLQKGLGVFAALAEPLRCRRRTRRRISRRRRP